MKQLSFTMFIWLLITCTVTRADFINISVENRDFYPFFFLVQNSPKGILLDMVRDGFAPLGIKPVFTPYPMKRALRMVEAGKVDAIIAPRVSNKNLFLPDDAFQTNISQYRILQIDSVVVTYKSDYEFFGDIKTLPTPIRMTSGDPIESLFQKQGLFVDDAASGAQNIKKLIRDRKGCVITTSFKAMSWLESPAYKNSIDVSTESVVSRSYFLIFSNKTVFSQDQIKMVWKEIAKNRDDYIYPIKLFTGY